MTLGVSGARRVSSLCLAVTILLPLAACGNAQPATLRTTGSTTTPAPSASESESPGPSSEPPSSSDAAGDAVTPLFVIVFENKDADEILSGDRAPYLASLARDYSQATNYRAVAYPSQPNYLAIFSGSTHGVTDNEPHDIDAPTLAGQVEEAGLTWRMAVENVAPDCFTGPFSEDGVDGEGIYSRKHNPAISFTSISQDPVRCASITDLTHFDPEAADVTFIVPNACHSMHDCSIADGDEWLRGFLPRILESDAYRTGGVVFITFDEDRGDGDNLVATVVVSERAARGTASERPYTHYSLLRTIQELLRLPCLAESCNAEPMSDLLEDSGSD